MIRDVEETLVELSFQLIAFAEIIGTKILTSIMGKKRSKPLATEQKPSMDVFSPDEPEKWIKEEFFPFRARL